MEGRKARNAQFSALTQEPDPQTQPDTTEEDEGGKGEPEAVTAAAGDGNSGNNGVINVKLSDIVERAPTPDVPASNPRPVYSTLVAAAGVPNYEAGQRLETMLDVAKAFEARAYSHGAMAKSTRAGGQHQAYPVAPVGPGVSA